VKKLIFQLTDEQFEAYEKAAEQLLALGIPMQPKLLIQTRIGSRNADAITDEFLTQMRVLVNKGKKEITQQKKKGNLS
jgi:hypothetical protein